MYEFVESTLKERKYQLPVAIFDIQDVDVLVASAGRKESQFYSLTFGQAVTTCSMY